MESDYRNGGCLGNQNEYSEYCLASACAACSDGSDGRSEPDVVRCGDAVVYEESAGQPICARHFIRCDLWCDPCDRDRRAVVSRLLCGRGWCVRGINGGDSDRLLYGEKRKRSGTDQAGAGRNRSGGDVYRIFEFYRLQGSG